MCFFSSGHRLWRCPRKYLVLGRRVEANLANSIGLGGCRGWVTSGWRRWGWVCVSGVQRHNILMSQREGRPSDARPANTRYMHIFYLLFVRVYYVCNHISMSKLIQMITTPSPGLRKHSCIPLPQKPHLNFFPCEIG